MNETSFVKFMTLFAIALFIAGTAGTYFLGTGIENLAGGASSVGSPPGPAGPQDASDLLLELSYFGPDYNVHLQSFDASNEQKERGVVTAADRIWTRDSDAAGPLAIYQTIEIYDTVASAQAGFAYWDEATNTEEEFTVVESSTIDMDADQSAIYELEADDATTPVKFMVRTVVRINSVIAVYDVADPSQYYVEQAEELARLPWKTFAY
ncbi:MAG: hypothetical protein HYS81_03815 [Candidatus Aenigmatarchaeota archaeon]|nr:MAG: hypothetical protein HYS81_03815 [Candidatus Aenigmarchaeota archaeon]